MENLLANVLAAKSVGNQVPATGLPDQEANELWHREDVKYEGGTINDGHHYYCLALALSPSTV